MFAVLFFMGALAVREVVYLAAQHHQEAKQEVKVSSTDQVYDVASTHINIEGDN